MHSTKFLTTGFLCLLLAGLTAGTSGDRPQRNKLRHSSQSPERTLCDPTLPIHIELLALNKPDTGQAAQFEVRTESTLDPDLIQDSWVEYQVRRNALPKGQDVPLRRETIGRVARDQRRFSVAVPDQSRQEIRARYVVRLSDGRTIAQTAIRWVDPGPQDPPEGRIGRILNPDGTGIAVYRGVKVR